MKKEFMKRAIRLAQKGRGQVHPNPMVGAVLVKDDLVIAEGYHALFGGPHAEIAALSQVSPVKSRKSTMYINLEPCVHHGKTPPCTEAIIKAGIKKVVIGTEDPNPKVSGRGILALKKAGVEVEVGILGNECRRLNEAFFKFIQQKQPFVTIKIAQSLDGKIATENGLSRWITCEISRKKVHRMRAEHDAVMVGVNTVLRDDPELSVRHIKGKGGIRIVLDTTLKVPLSSKILKNQDVQKTIIATSSKADPEKIHAVRKTGADVWILPEAANSGIRLKSLWSRMIKEGMISVLVEGGCRVFTSVLASGITDRLVIFTAPKIFGSGLDAIGDLNVKKPSEALQFNSVKWKASGTDIMFDGRLECLQD